MDKAKRDMMDNFTRWLRGEMGGINTSHAVESFEFFARKYLEAAGEIEIKVVTPNLSKRQQIRARIEAAGISKYEEELHRRATNRSDLANETM